MVGQQAIPRTGSVGCQSPDLGVAFVEGAVRCQIALMHFPAALRRCWSPKCSKVDVQIVAFKTRRQTQLSKMAARVTQLARSCWMWSLAFALHAVRFPGRSQIIDGEAQGDLGTRARLRTPQFLEPVAWDMRILSPFSVRSAARSARTGPGPTEPGPLPRRANCRWASSPQPAASCASRVGPCPGRSLCGACR